MTPESIVSELLAGVPELRDIYDEHISRNDTLLPHVFMGDVARFVTAHAGDNAFGAALRRLLAVLERGMQDNPAVRELVAASFVENLAGEKTTLAALRPNMGPLLQRQCDELSSS